jgi:PKD repeat protein
MVTLTGFGSTDTDGTITAYQWTEGATVLGDTASITREFSVGVHTVTLTVTDNGGATASDTVTITVSPPSELSETEFAFSGTVAPRGELRHVVSVSGPATMSVRLTWVGWTDLRLRIYSPTGQVAEVDQSTWVNMVEEITINIADELGEWQVAAKSDDRWRSTSYTIEGLVEY